MANGTIAFDTLSTSGQISGTAKSVDTDYLAYGSAKVWNKTLADGTGIEDSFNIASLTDTASGRQAHNFSTNMASANYAPQITATTSNPDAEWLDTISSSSCGGRMWDGSAYVDKKQSVTVHGDVA